MVAGPGGDQPASPPPQPILGSVVLATDGLTLLYSRAPYCQQGQLLATASPARITLSVTYEDLGLAGCGGPPSPFSASRAAFPLPTALGDRPVADALTGAPIPVFRAVDALRLPSPVPPAVALVPPAPSFVPGAPLTSIPWTPPPSPPPSPLDEWARSPTAASQAPDFGGPGSATIALRYFGIDRTTRGYSSTDLIVIATTGRWSPDPATPTTPTTVRGLPGYAAAGIVVWQERGMTFAVRIDSPQHAPRPTAQLTALAALLNTEGPASPAGSSSPARRSPPASPPRSTPPSSPMNPPAATS